MFASIVVLAAILAVAYRTDYSMLRMEPMLYRVTYGLIFLVGFAIAACYLINPNFPNVLDVIERTMATNVGDGHA